MQMSSYTTGEVRDPSVRLGLNCKVDSKLVGPAHIGENAKVGKDCKIRSGLQLGFLAKIGDHCIVGQDVTVFERGEIGNHNTIGDQVVIQQHSSVSNGSRIQERVVIGAYTRVNSACLIGEDTRIESSCSIDHYVSIGRHCLVSEKSILSYRSKLEDDVTLFGFVHVCGYVTIPSGLVIGRLDKRGMVLYETPPKIRFNDNSEQYLFPMAPGVVGIKWSKNHLTTLRNVDGHITNQCLKTNKLNAESTFYVEEVKSLVPATAIRKMFDWSKERMSH